MAEAETLAFLVGLLVALAIVAQIGVYAARYKRVPPNRAMIVYGRKFGPKGFIVLTSGGKFILPILESFAFLSLEPFEFDLSLADVPLGSGPPGTRVVDLHATGIARISADPKDLERAASSLPDKAMDQIRALAESVLQDRIRRAFAAAAPASHAAPTEAIREGAQADLNEFGIRLVSFSLAIRPAHGS